MKAVMNKNLTTAANVYPSQANDSRPLCLFALPYFK